MNSNKYSYRLGQMLAGVLVWEAVFWLLAFIVFQLFGFGEVAINGDQLAFKKPELLWLIFVVVPLLVIYLNKLNRSNQLARQTSSKLQAIILLPVSSFHSFLRFFFLRNTLVFLIIAMAQPIFGNKKVAGSVESLDLVIALDVSNSMNTKDVDTENSRLDISKRAIIQLINQLHGEKLGICVFAGGAYVQLPLTSDYYAAKMFVNEIETDMISNQGTNIAQALETSLEMFSKATTTKGIILVTDGENHEADPEEIITRIVDQNIQLCVMGIGTVNGGLIPNNPNRPELGYRTGLDGRKIVSKVNPHLISDLASKAHGYSMISRTPFPDLTELMKQIHQLKRSKIEEVEFDVKETRYQLPLLLSIIFWLLFTIWTRNTYQLFDKFTAVK